MKPNHRLKHAREQRGWSQARVAEQIGTDAGNVSRWERGYSSPSPYYREKLSTLFGKEVQDLGLLIEEDNECSSPDAPDVPLTTSPGQPSEKQQRSEILSLASRLLAAFSYLLFWCTGLLMLLFFYRKNRFIHFHSLQSFFLFGGVAFCNIAFIGIVSSVPLDFIRVLAVLCVIVLNIGAIVSWIVGMVMALRGKYYRLPLVGNSSEKITATLFSH